MRLDTLFRWAVACAIILLIGLHGLSAQAAQRPEGVTAQSEGAGVTNGTFSDRSESFSPPVIDSITYITSGTDAGKLDIVLTTAGGDAASYQLCYGTQARSGMPSYPGGYPYEWQRITAAMEMKVPFFGCTASTLHVALVSVNASGTPDTVYSNEINASIGVVVWPTNSVALTSAMTHLTSDNLYTVSADITFGSGSSLVIDPGVVIKVLANSSHYNIITNGTLEAKGETFRKVYFTSSNDATVGGGSGTPAVGDWGSLVLHPSTSSGNVVIDQCEFRYGGNSSGSYPADAFLYLNNFGTGATATITSTTLNYSGASGLRVHNNDGAISTRTLYLDNITASYNIGSGIYLNGYGSRKVILTTPVNGDGHLDITATNNGRYPVEIAAAVACELQPDASQGASVVATGNTLSNMVAWNGGTIASPQTMHWSSVGAPYLILATSTFDPGTAVTLDPGVVIKVLADTNKYNIFINGALTAQGQGSSKVYITSSNDATVGGGAGTPATGDWGSLVVHSSTSTGSIAMDQCEVRYGGGISSYPADTYIYLNNFGVGATATITSCTFSHSSNNGFVVVNYDGSASSKTLYADNVTAVYNTKSGIYLDGYGSRKVILTTPANGDGHLDITATNNGRYPVEIAFNVVGELGTGASQGANVAASDNTLGNAVAWNGGDIGSNQTMHWNVVGPPYALIANYFTFDAGTAVTLDPGVVVKMLPSQYSNLSVNIDGSLTADGTAAAPIIFTSWDDNTIGGNTGNGNPQPGSWGNFLFHNTASDGSFVLNHCEIRWGGHYGFGGSLVVNVRDQSGQIDIRNSTISHSGTGTAGVLFYGHLTQPHTVAMTTCTIKDCAGPALSAFNYVATPLLITTPDCVFTGNNGGRPNAQMTYSGTNPVFVDASLCYWGYEDLDGWAVVPDGWRVSPWYTSDPASADLLSVDKWTGNFNPDATDGYKNSCELGLTSAVSKSWKMRIWGPNPADPPQGTPLYTTTASGTTFSPAPWGSGQAAGKYIVYITDDNQPTGPTLRADVWADSTLFGIITKPLPSQRYGNITGVDLQYEGRLQLVRSGTCSGQRYVTALQETTSSSVAQLAKFDGYSTSLGNCSATAGSPVKLADPQAISSLGGTHQVAWKGNQAGNPASWIAVDRSFAVSKLLISLGRAEVSGSATSPDVLTVAIDAGNVDGTVTNQEVKIVRRKLEHDPSVLPCTFCRHGGTAFSPPVSGGPANFIFHDTDVVTLTNPVVNGSVSTYSWNAANHGNGLYAASVKVTATVNGITYTDVMPWGVYKDRALMGFAGTGVSTTQLVDPDNCGRFKYDGRHLLTYSLSQGWISSGGTHPPLIMDIKGGLFYNPDYFANLDRMVAPMDGVGDENNTWYWDGVFSGHQITRQVPVASTNPLKSGFLIMEQLTPDLPAGGCPLAGPCTRNTLSLGPGEFVVKGYGKLIEPVLQTGPDCRLDPNAGANRLAVSITAVKNCSVMVKLWPIGFLRDEISAGNLPVLTSDPDTPTVPAITNGPYNINGGNTFTWGHTGVLSGGYLLKEGLYEVEVTATDDHFCEQTTYQVLPFTW